MLLALFVQSVRIRHILQNPLYYGTEAVLCHICILLPSFHNVSHSNISHIHVDVNESRHIYYLDSLTSI